MTRGPETRHKTKKKKERIFSTRKSFGSYHERVTRIGRNETTRALLETQLPPVPTLFPAVPHFFSRDPLHRSTSQPFSPLRCPFRPFFSPFFGLRRFFDTYVARNRTCLDQRPSNTCHERRNTRTLSIGEFLIAIFINDSLETDAITNLPDELSLHRPTIPFIRYLSTRLTSVTTIPVHEDNLFYDHITCALNARLFQ